jgi:hypothetical protein
MNKQTKEKEKEMKLKGAMYAAGVGEDGREGKEDEEATEGKDGGGLHGGECGKLDLLEVLPFGLFLLAASLVNSERTTTATPSSADTTARDQPPRGETARELLPQPTFGTGLW